MTGDGAGATETDFFERADLLDTKVGQAKQDDPADVARVGFEAMMRGDGDVVSGWKNKLQSAIANVTRRRPRPPIRGRSTTARSAPSAAEIGRASCRERVFGYV